MENEQIAIKLTELESSTKSAHKRIDELHDLIKAVSELANEIKHMREDLNETADRVSELEKTPIKRYETFITALITGGVGVLIGFLCK